MSKDFDITKEIDDVFDSVSVKKEEIADVENVEEKKPEEEVEETSEMARLLKKYPVFVPNVGEKIKGKITNFDAHATYIDLGTLGTGIVYAKEIKDGFGADRKKVGVGEEVVAVIQDLENEDGYVELSIREAVREEAWKDLQKKKESKESLDTKIIDANKGGLMLEINGITGFMPVSQLTAEHYPRVEDGDKNKILEILRTYTGTEMRVCVIDIDPEEEKLIVSEKEANREKEKTAIAELRVGDIVQGEVSGVVDFGAFVKFLPPSKKTSEREEDKLEGLVHISQLDWQLIDDPRKIVKVGDAVRAKIISIDDTRISLSVRELKNDPWASVAERYKVGDQVQGNVNKINHFGAFVYLDNDIHGLAHVSGFPDYPRKGIDEIVKIGDNYIWQIMSMEPNEHRMGLKFVSEIKKEKKKEVEEAKTEKAAKEKEVVAEKEEKEVEKEKAEKKVDKKEIKKKEKVKEEIAENKVKKEKKAGKKVVKKEKSDKKETKKKAVPKKSEKKETKKADKKKESSSAKATEDKKSEK
jgi:small subunit ribosomal protein S1